MSIHHDRLSPELAFLLDCCGVAAKRGHVQEESDGEQILLALQSRAIGWDRFFQLVELHVVQPLVFDCLSLPNVKSYIPASIYQTLRQQQHVGVQQTMRQTAALLRLQRAFMQADVTFLPLKGTVLSQRLFGNFSMRLFGDLDLYIAPEDLERVEEIVQGLGYRRVSPGFTLSSRARAVYLHSRHHFVYGHVEHGIKLELHWKPFAKGRVLDSRYFTQMVERTHTLEVNGTPFLCLADGDLLLYLAIHGSYHRWSRLKWLVDIAALLQQPLAIDWPAWKAEITTYELQHAIIESTVLANQLLGAPIPPAMAPWIREEDVDAIVADVLPYLSMSRKEWRGVGKINRARISRIRNRFRLRRNIGHFAEAFYGLWVEPDDWRDFPLPDVLFPLYYPLRPFFWLWRYAIPKS